MADLDATSCSADADDNSCDMSDAQNSATSAAKDSIMNEVRELVDSRNKEIFGQLALLKDILLKKNDSTSESCRLDKEVNKSGMTANDVGESSQSQGYSNSGNVYDGSGPSQAWVGSRSPSMSIHAGADFDDEESDTPVRTFSVGKDEEVHPRSLAEGSCSGSVSGDSEELDQAQGNSADQWNIVLESVAQELGCPTDTVQAQDLNKSYLTGGAKPVVKKRVQLPLEGLCKDAFDKLAANGMSRIPLYKSQTEQDFRVREDDYVRFLRAPKLDKATELRVRSDSQTLAKSQVVYPNPIDRRNDVEFYEIDKTARVGLATTSHLALLLASLQKRLGSEVQDDSLLALLGYAINATMCSFDQLARVSCRSVIARRRIALNNMRLPDLKLKEDLMKIPLHGEDLFGGKFSEKTRDHAQILQDMKATCDKEGSFGKGLKRPGPRSGEGPKKRFQAATSSKPAAVPTGPKPSQERPGNPSWSNRGQQGGRQQSQGGNAQSFRKKGKFYGKFKSPQGRF